MLANIFLWLCVFAASRHYALLLSAGLLAYGFGLRHAVDADHISAIDNTTRKLMQEGKRPIGVGFYFSLGHSTVVILLCLALTLSSTYVQHHLPQWKAFGAIAGTLISSIFLYLIGFINLAVLWDLAATYRRTKKGEQPEGEEPAAMGGLLVRFCQPVLRLVTRSWQMYLVGFLFGLGFDTATEVGILALSARSGQTGVPFWAIMLLPLIFTVGMCLIDTADGILMLGAYGWAFVSPRRKLGYNLGITLLSVLVAFVVGTYELMQIVQQQLALHGWFWEQVSRLNLDNLGFIIIGTFAAAWLIAFLVSRRRKDENRVF